MALPAGRVPSGASATQVRRYQPPSGCGSSSRAAMSDSPGRTAPVWSAAGGGDTGAGGHRHRVHGGTAKQHAIGGGALDVEVGVVLPGETDTAEGLDRFTAHENLAVVACGLGHGDGGGAHRRVLVYGGGGEIAQGAGPLDGEEHVAHFVLQGLEGTDGHTELLALLQVGQQQLEERVAGADTTEREPEGRLLEATRDAERGRRAAGLAQCMIVRDEDAVEDGFDEGTAGVERLHGRQTCLGDGHHERTETLADPGEDADVGRAPGSPGS